MESTVAQDELPFELISPPRDAISFEVDGVVYKQTEGLTVARRRIFEKLKLELGFDTRIKAFMDGLSKAKEQLNKMELFNGIHTIGNMMDAVNVVGANRLRDVEICALFFNAPDEDPAQYDFNLMQEKCYTAWAKINSGFFFVKALSLLNEPNGVYSATPEAPDPLPTSEPTIE